MANKTAENLLVKALKTFLLSYLCFIQVWAVLKGASHMGQLRLCVSGSIRMQLCGDDSCGFCTSSPVGVVYQHRFGSQSEEKCQQHRKLVEMKFSLKRKSGRLDLKIHESGENCALCQEKQIQLKRRCAFCLQSLLRRRSLPSTQREEEEKV